MRTEKAKREVRIAGDRYLCLIRVYAPNRWQAGPRLTLRTTPFYTMIDPDLLPSLLSQLLGPASDFQNREGVAMLGSSPRGKRVVTLL